MNRLRQEMKVIPRFAWAAAFALTLGLLTGLLVYSRVILRANSTSPLEFPSPLEVLMGSIIFAIVFTYILLIGYIAGDARRRGMRAVLWTLLAIFIPNAIGIILYFILREPLLRPCPKCGTGTKAAFPFCPSCGASLADTCPSCQNSVEPEWSHCARCGARLAVA